MTKEETLIRLKEPLSGGMDKYEVVSEWLLAEYVASPSYPYLDQCQEEIIKAHGLVLAEDEARRMKTLIYNASTENHRRMDKADGWEAATGEWLAAHESRIVDVRGESIFGYSLKTATVKRVGGELYLVPPRARRRAFAAYSVKVRFPRRAGLTPMAGAVKIEVRSVKEGS